jgi:hypothetical protein
VRERLEADEMRQGREGGCVWGSKRARDVGRDVAELLGMRAWAGSAAVAGRTELTGWAHGANARARKGKRHGADGLGPRRRERECAWLGRLVPTGWPHRAEGERGRGRACARCADWAERPKERGFQLLFCFSFIPNFLY